MRKVELSLGLRFIKFAEGRGNMKPFAPEQYGGAQGAKLLTNLFGTFGKDILKAERFVLSNEVANSVSDILQKTQYPEVLLEQRKMLRAPYPLTWVEMPLTDYAMSFRTTHHQQAHTIDSIGMLIKKQPDKELYTLTAAWKYKDSEMIGMGNYQTHIDLGDEVPSFMTPLQMKMYDDSQKLKAIPIEKVEEICRRMMFLPSYYMMSAMREAGSVRNPDDFAAKWAGMEQAYAQQGINPMQEATEENQTLFSAWLLLFNAKSGTRHKEFSVEHARKLPSFGSKKKKMFITNHKYTVISMKDYENEDGSESDTHTVAKRHAHYVRGHFKQRATGMFWWNPYMRNREETYVPREAYTVI
jgi:hypothetical protein